MSAILDTAIINRLIGTESPALPAAALTVKTSLAALLGSDPDTGEKSVYKRVLSTGEPLVYPCIRFDPSGGGRTGPGMAGVIGDPIYDFEMWDKTEDDSNLSTIADYVEQLLDYGRGVAPKLPVSQGKNFYVEAFTEPMIEYVETYKALVLLVRYRFIWSRA